MAQLCCFLLLLVCCLCPSKAHEEEQIRAAKDPTWLNLIQVHDGVKTGAADFYWSSQAITAEEELKSSLAAVLDPLQRPAFACRFPARFYYLSHRFALTGAMEQLRQCERLSASIELDRIEKISLILVGSYLSNPASSFGHTLVRLHQRSAQGVEKDLSFNYGALIPPKEHVVAYISKGIFGWYEAAYSDQEPFVHDITYNHLENRDSWVYGLRQSEEDRLLVALHLWEMAGAKFQYFFFSRNCAWQMANSLQLTLKDRSEQRRSIPFWTLPVDVVHELQGKGVIDQVTHVPSHQKRLNTALERLSEEDGKRFLHLVQSGAKVDARQDSVAVIDAVLDYYTWRNSSNSQKLDQERLYASLREQAVSERLQLPAETHPEPAVQEPSPVDGNKPIRFSLGYQDRPTLSWSVYSQGPMDPHTLGIGHIRALVLDVARVSDQWQIDAFTFLDIERIQTKDRFRLDGFSPSWRMRLDMFRDDGNLQPQAKAGIGWSHKQENWTVSVYADVLWKPGELYADPALSLHHRGDQTQFQVEVSSRGQRAAAIQFQLSRSHFVTLNYQKHQKDALGLSVGTYW